MKITLSTNHVISLTPEQSRALEDEMRYACREVSVFPMMERVLRLMRA